MIKRFNLTYRQNFDTNHPDQSERDSHGFLKNKIDF